MEPVTIKPPCLSCSQTNCKKQEIHITINTLKNNKRKESIRKLNTIHEPFSLSKLIALVNFNEAHKKGLYQVLNVSILIMQIQTTQQHEIKLQKDQKKDGEHIHY